MFRLKSLGIFLLLGAALAGCGASDSATDLNPEGPPQVMQVFMQERITEGTVMRSVLALAFGSHEQFTIDNPGDDGSVETAVVEASQRLRIVLDELLIGNYLEQIACRDGSYQSVPEGATPDDIAKCAVAQDLLPTSCSGDYAVCFDADGAPVGVMDADENGSADDTRFIEGSVRILCNPREDAAREIDVPIQLSNSYWQPSGNQQVPAAGGYGALGPAIVLAPAIALPTNSECRIAFDESVVDKDHNAVCASPGGSIETECTAGDTSVVVFGSEVLALAGTSPVAGMTATATPGTAQTIVIQLNAPVPQTIPDGAIVVTHDGGAAEAITVTRNAMNNTRVDVSVTNGFAAGATYTVDYSGLTDFFGVGLPSGTTTTFTFTTAP